MIQGARDIVRVFVCLSVCVYVYVFECVCVCGAHAANTRPHYHHHQYTRGKKIIKQDNEGNRCVNEDENYEEKLYFSSAQ